MSTLQEIRDKVRLQADLDQTDLPDATLDGFIREGFDRTFAVEVAWPFFESTWTLTLPSGDTTIPLPTSPEIAQIKRFRSPDNMTLEQVPQSAAEDYFQGTQTAGEPQLFSVWGGNIYLWPEPTAAERIYTVRGYRKPTWSGLGTSELDGDDRLHLAIFHYAVALAYAQLEDTELEGTYLRRWDTLLRQLQRDIMQPAYHEPIVLNGGVGLTTPRNRFNLVV